MISRKISIGSNAISFSIEEASDKVIQEIVDNVAHEDLAAGMFAIIDNTFLNLGVCGDKIFKLEMDEELKTKIFAIIIKCTLTNLSAVYPIAMHINSQRFIKIASKYCIINGIDINDRDIFADLQKDMRDYLDELRNKEKEKTNE